MPVSKKRKPKHRNKRKKSYAKARNLENLVHLAELLDSEENRLVQETLDDAVDPRPCKGENADICVANGCHDQSCVTRFEED